MKVMMILPNLRIGGAERHFLALAEEFTRLGLEVTIAPIRAEGPLHKVIPEGIKVVQLLPERVLRVLKSLERVGPLGAVHRKNFIRFAIDILSGTPERLHKLCKKTRCDVVLSSLWEADFVVGWALSKEPGGIRWIVVGETDLEVHIFRRPLRRWAFRILGRNYRHAKAFIAPSSRIQQQLHRLAGGKNVPIWLIPNAVQVERIRALAEEPVALPDFGGYRVVMAMGRLMPEKGFDQLLRAFALVLRTLPQTRLVILGDGPMRGELEELARRLGVDDAILLPGFTLNPYPWISRADVMAVPSRWETFGNVVVEAMALGVPVVATRCGGPEDIIEDGRDGFLVEAEDTEALAGAILRLLSDPRLRDHMGALAEEKAAQFSSEFIARKYLTCLMGSLC